MKKIFIKAYSQNNLGDDLFIEMLCRRYPQHHFVMPCAPEFEETFKHITNLERLPVIPFIDGVMHRFKLPFRPKRAYYRHIMKRCDATVHIGGSLFIESMFPLSEIKQYAHDVKASQSYYLLGLNFGPFYNLAFYSKMYDVFRKIDDLCFRDEYSYGLFEDLPQTRFAPDIVFGLKTHEFPTTPDKTHLVISVIDLENRPDLAVYQKAYEDKLIALSEAAFAKGLNVTLMSFCQDEGDEAAIQRINLQLNGKADEYFYRGNLNEALQVLNSAKGITATRFHALILGWVLNRNVYPICYSTKMTNVIDDVRFPGYYANIQSIDELDVSIALEQLMSDTTFDIESYKTAANNHFTELDKL